MATLEDAIAFITSLPEVMEGERFRQRTWSVDGTAFAWERPFSKADVKRFGDEPVPDGAILAVRVADLVEKEAVLAEAPRGVFTITHFDNYPAVLVQLRVVGKRVLRDLILDAWLACAPARLTAAYER